MPDYKDRHMVYAEDILYAIMQHPNKTITKGEIKQIIEQVVEEKEVTIGRCLPFAGID